jgi:hypothetical protein
MQIRDKLQMLYHGLLLQSNCQGLQADLSALILEIISRSQMLPSSILKAALRT